MKFNFPEVKGIKVPKVEFKTPSVADVFQSGNSKNVGKLLSDLVGSGKKVYSAGVIKGGSSKKSTIDAFVNAPMQKEIVMSHKMPVKLSNSASSGRSGDTSDEGRFKEKDDKRNVVFNISIGNMSGESFGKSAISGFDGSLHGGNMNRVRPESVMSENLKKDDLKANHVVYVNPNKYIDRVIADSGKQVAFNRVYDPSVFFDRHIKFPQSGRDVIMGKHFREHDDNFGKFYIDKPFQDLINRKMGKIGLDVI